MLICLINEDKCENKKNANKVNYIIKKYSYDAETRSFLGIGVLNDDEWENWKEKRDRNAQKELIEIGERKLASKWINGDIVF